MENWISTNQESGTSGTNLVTAVATSNSGLKRSTELTVTATKWGITKTAKVKINQASIYSGISMTNIVPDSSGGTYQVTVMSEGPFAVSASDPTWIILSPTSGTGGTQVITVVIPANETGADRTGGITATTLDGRYTDDISFTQENMPISGISISSIQPEDTGGTYVITVTSETPYTISASDPTWIILSPTSGGSGITTVSVVIPENSTGSGRTGGITATTTDNQYSDSISFTQQSVYVPTGVTINGSVNPADTGGSYTITIESDLPFTVSASDSTWITVSPSSGGSGTTTVTVTITGNDTGSGRTGGITATTTNGTFSDSISFTQQPEEPVSPYYGMYFITKSLANNGRIDVTIPMQTTPAYGTSISYSLDSGITWNTKLVSNYLVSINISGLTENQEVYWKGDAETWGYSNNNGLHFYFTGNFNVYGNIMSLLYQDNFQDKTSIHSGYSYTFAHLFENETGLIDAENLVLPVGELNDYCYYAMFKGCTSLTKAPLKIDAQTIGNFSCWVMFEGCTSLTTAPDLPATTLGDNAFYAMFHNCTSLANAPFISATSLSSECCRLMFYDCTSLTTVQSALPATILADNCYEAMFSGCSSLATAPNLPATTLAEECYYDMFHNCTSLATAPDLPATTLAPSCYEIMFFNCTSLTNPPVMSALTLAYKSCSGMFYGCTSLKSAPELYATTLPEECYGGMFEDCTSLNYIKCLATSGINTNYSTWFWVNGVAANGTFVKASSATWPTGVDGIPSGWTVVDAT